MSEKLTRLRERVNVLNQQKEQNEARMKELLENPLVKEFKELFTANEKINGKLFLAEEELAIAEMEECRHAFIITDIITDRECDRIVRNPVYYCVRCGLTNHHDLLDLNDIVDDVKGQMGEIFRDTSMNGTLLSNEIISVDSMVKINEAVSMNPNITNEELKKVIAKLSTNISEKENDNSGFVKRKVSK